MFVGIIETLCFTVFLRKSLDDANAWNGVCQHIGDLRPNTVNFLKARAQSFSDNMNYRHYLNTTRIVRTIPARVPTTGDIFGDYHAKHGR